MNENHPHPPMDLHARGVRSRYPEPGTSTLQHLRHTLAVFADDTTPDDREVLTATGNIYGDGVRTGLDFGDLRAVLALLERYDGGPGDVLSSKEYRDVYGTATETAR